MDEPAYSKVIEKYKQLIEVVRRFCSYQERTPNEVKEKIKKTNKDINDYELIQIISVLKDEGYLDEKRFLQNYINSKVRVNKWGRNKIRFELEKKKISMELIKQYLNNIDEEEYGAVLEKIIRSKVKNKDINTLSVAEKQKLIRFALSKGFEYELIVKHF